MSAPKSLIINSPYERPAQCWMRVCENMSGHAGMRAELRVKKL